MRVNPRDWRIEDVGALCDSFGVELSPPAGGGSHWKVKHPDVAHILTIPSKRPIKPVYIRDLIQFIEAVRGVSK
jgi:hypothetical protein